MKWFAWLLPGLLAAITTVSVGTAQDPSSPSFTASGELVLPSDYREWVFVGTGFGMTYGAETRPVDQPPTFDNVYVTREAYRAFLQSGKWPERTILMMEGRASQTHQLLANRGTVQGEATFIEAAVKDAERFPDTGWGYFAFGSASASREAARPLPPSFDCYSCHAENTAVEHTFVQYYPALLEVAKKFGTVKATYDPTRRF